MAKRRCYLDANVFITAWRGGAQIQEQLQTLFNDPNRSFVISDFVVLEVLPKPFFHKNDHEIVFMKSLLENCEKISVTPTLIQQAITIASDDDLSPLDALHLAAAIVAQVDEFITFERPEKPICRQSRLPIMSLFQGSYHA